MPSLTRLFEVGSIADSMRVYLPARAFQKALGLGRWVVLLYLLTTVEYGLWGLGMMVFVIGAPLVTLGTNHGIIRYVSFHEAHGRLGEFYRRMRRLVVVLGVGTTALAFAGSGPITKLAIASRSPAADVAYARQLHVCWAALGNALLLALYHNMLGVMVGMRVYRLAALVEVLFGVAFTALAVAAVAVWPTGLAALGAHFVALAIALAAGGALLHAAVEHRGRQEGAPVGEANGAADGGIRRVLHFGAAALAGTVTWQVAANLSFWRTSRLLGKTAGGVFHAFLFLGQPMLLLADAAWAVLLSHVARRWESGRRDEALHTLEAAYKAIALVLMTLTVLVLVASPLWVRILPERYRGGLPLLGGLLMLFEVLIHLAVLSIVAKLHERPIVIAAAGIAGLGANLALAVWWMPRHGAVGAAWAAGVGMYAGAGCVSAAYFLAAGVRLRAATWFVLACPALLLLPLAAPAWVLAGVWSAVLAAAAATGLLFDRGEKRLLWASARRLAGVFRRRNAAP